MLQEIEIEFSNLLTKEEFDYLLTQYPFPKQGKEQVNHYFETANFSLQDRLSALRIREINDQYVLTLKEPHETGLLETHETLSKEEALLWMAGSIVKKSQIEKQLNNLNININDMKYYGSLTTVRRELNYQDVLLVLDYSYYNDKHDYEFELEAPDEKTGEYVFNNILNDLQIKIKETPNKIERFFMSLPIS